MNDRYPELFRLRSPLLCLATAVALAGCASTPEPFENDPALMQEALNGTGSQRTAMVDPPAATASPDDASGHYCRAPSDHTGQSDVRPRPCAGGQYAQGGRANQWRHRVQLHRPAHRGGDQQRDGRPAARELQHRPGCEGQRQLFHLTTGEQAAGAVDSGDPAVLDRQRHDSPGRPLRHPAVEPGRGRQAGPANARVQAVQRAVGASVPAALYLGHRDAETAQAVRPRQRLPAGGPGAQRAEPGGYPG